MKLFQIIFKFTVMPAENCDAFMLLRSKSANKAAGAASLPSVARRCRRPASDNMQLLSDQGNHSPCILHWCLLLERQGEQVSSGYHTCISLPTLEGAPVALLGLEANDSQAAELVAHLERELILAVGEEFNFNLVVELEAQEIGELAVGLVADAEPLTRGEIGDVVLGHHVRVKFADQTNFHVDRVFLELGRDDLLPLFLPPTCGS